MKNVAKNFNFIKFEVFKCYVDDFYSEFLCSSPATEGKFDPMNQTTRK
jgi:hypothetical protein